MQRIQPTAKRISPPACLEAARDYARRGWPVFPVNGKVPLTTRGFKDASQNEGRIRYWWAKWPSAGVAIPTGTPSGLVVLDVDPRHGGEASLEALEAKFGRVPRTVQTLTGGDGLHFFFRHPGGTVPSSSLGPGLDLKADGGYVLVPPSPHPTGHPYFWEGSSEPGMVALAPFEWLERVLNGHSSSGLGADRPPVEPQGILEGVPEGQRDRELFRYACLLRRKGLEREEAELLILTAARACKPPFPEVEARRKLEQAWKHPPGRTEAIEAPAVASDPSPSRLADWPGIPAVLASMPPPGQRLSTGIPTLDDALRGGLAPGRIHMAVGPPTRGKTAFVTQLGLRSAREHGALVVGIYADEGSWQAGLMMAEGVGFKREQLEDAYDDVRQLVENALGKLPIRLPDPGDSSSSLEAVEETLVAAGYGDKTVVLIVDSTQRVRCKKADAAKEPKERADSVMTTLRGLITRHRSWIVLVTSKANRASWSRRNPADNIDPLAAGLDSSSIEYDSDFFAFLEGDIDKAITLGVHKNRSGTGQKPRIRLAFDRATATFTEIDQQAAAEDAAAARKEDENRKTAENAERLRKALAEHPRSTARELREFATMKEASVYPALRWLKERGKAQVWKSGNRMEWELT